MRSWEYCIEVGPVWDRDDGHIKAHGLLFKELFHIAAHCDDLCDVFVDESIKEMNGGDKERVLFRAADSYEYLGIAVLDEQCVAGPLCQARDRVCDRQAWRSGDHHAIVTAFEDDKRL